VIAAAGLAAQTPVRQPEIRDAALKSLSLLDGVNRTWLKQGYCYSCHNDGLFNKLHSVARRHGLPVDETVALRAARKTYGWASNADEAIQGFYFVDPALVDGHELIALHDAGYPATLPLQAYARRLAHLQTPAGNWISSDRRPPQSNSQWSATEVSLEAIRDYLPESLAAKKREIFRRAQQWLTTAKPESAEDGANQVLALLAIDAPKSAIARAVEELTAAQRHDGGWSQIPYRPSDSYATGLVLAALNAAGVPPAAPSYQRGLRFLIDTQKPDGSWYVRTRLVYPIPISPPYMETGFPYKKDQIISEMGTIWSTIALALALDHPAAPHVPYGGEPLLTSAGTEPAWLKTALFGSPAELQGLLDSGLDPNIATPGGTPLLLAVAPEPEKLKLIVHRVRDVNVRAPRTQFNALMVAASHTNTFESVRLLLDNGAKVGVQADPQAATVPSPLFLSSGTAEPAKATLLLARGDSVAQVWTRAPNDYTALGNAVDLHDADLIRDLVKAGAPVNPHPPSHLTPLARAVTSNQADIVKELIDLGADVNQRDGNGIAPLEYAAMADYGDANVLNLLLTAGAQTDIKSKEGLTPLEIARKYDLNYLVAALEQGGRELPVRRIPNIGASAEFYFGPDSFTIIGNAKREGDSSYHVYLTNLDGASIRRINDRGDDACSFIFPDGKRLIWTSTRDHADLPKGNFSDPKNYPQGAELYTSNLEGGDVQRLTNNTTYEAEVSVSPDGKWILFGRQTNGKMELWRMRPDGSGELQITHLDGWQPGGAQYKTDSKTILFRAWRVEDEGRPGGMPMSIFTISHDGTGLRRVTADAGTNWAPYPAPDGRHYAFVKVLPPRNYEIYLGDLESDEQIRLTYSDAFDGFPAISPDGHWLLFTSSRDTKPGTRSLTQYVMDISSLHVGSEH
jgi:Tol biopolymer transport system component/ankyrin repeat protein